MDVIKPPTKVRDLNPEERFLFLGGSIEMGAVENWQDEVIAKMAARSGFKDTVVLNPRRDGWDTTWVQSIDNPLFKEQVDWELDGLKLSSNILFYFHPKTKAPITLMELGLMAGTHGDGIVVVCPDGFWRKGNVDIVCQRHRIKVFTDLDAALGCLELSLPQSEHS